MGRLSIEVTVAHNQVRRCIGGGGGASKAAAPGEEEVQRTRKYRIK